MLRDAADITAGLRAGTRELPAHHERARRRPRVRHPRPAAHAELDRPARPTALHRARRRSRATRPPSGSLIKLSEALTLLEPTLDDLRAAQVDCNLLAVNLRNQGDAVSRGDQQGTWLSFLPLIDSTQGVRATRAVAEPALQPVPGLDGTRVRGRQRAVRRRAASRQPETRRAEPARWTRPRPPQDATARARAAGLLDPIAGADAMSAAARPNRRVNRSALGVLAIVLIAIGVFFVFTKRIPFVHGYRLNADFASSNQLVAGLLARAHRRRHRRQGHEDRQGGPGNLTRVQMELKDTALPIHADARVRIRPRLFLEGGFYVELDPGSPSAPVHRRRVGAPVAARPPARSSSTRS